MLFDHSDIYNVFHISNDDGSFKSFDEICALYNTDVANSSFHKKIIRSITTDKKDLLWRIEICNIDNNCYVNNNGDKTDLQRADHNGIYRAQILKKLDKSTAPRRHLWFK